MIGNKQPKIFYGYIVVAASFLIYMVMWGTYYTFGIFFEPLLAEFGWTRAMTSGAFSLTFVILGLSGVVIGKLTDRFGPRVVVTACGLFLGLGYLLMSQVSIIWQLYLFYGVIIGFGISGGFIPLVSTVARWFVKRRGMMTGIAVSGLGIGTLVMSPLANWLISTYGWRNSYMIIGIANLVLIILAAQFLRYGPGQMGQLPYGENESEEKRSLQTSGLSLQGVIHSRQFWMLGAALFCFGLSLGAIMVHIAPHAIALGISTAGAAVILAVIGGLNTGGRVTMGITGDRIGNKLAFIISIALISVALFWVLAAKESWMLYLFAVLFGFGYGGIVALVSPVIAEQFGLRAHGVIMGFIMLGATFGNGIGPVVAGHIFDITGSYNLAFLIFAILSVIGLMLMLLLKSTGREGEANEPKRST